MKQAVIDVGSNSVRLLAMEDELPLARGSITTRLMSGIIQGKMAEEAMERTAQAVYAHVQRAREMGVERIYAFGTSAVRDAANRDLLLNRVKALCQLELEVMSGSRRPCWPMRARRPKAGRGDRYRGRQHRAVVRE